jgi:hypothetical protein
MEKQNHGAKAKEAVSAGLLGLSIIGFPIGFGYTVVNSGTQTENHRLLAEKGAGSKKAEVSGFDKWIQDREAEERLRREKTEEYWRTHSVFEIGKINYYSAIEFPSPEKTKEEISNEKKVISKITNREEKLEYLQKKTLEVKAVFEFLDKINLSRVSTAPIFTAEQKRILGRKNIARAGIDTSERISSGMFVGSEKVLTLKIYFQLFLEELKDLELQIK